MRSKESFNQAAELYNEVRPSYPDKVINFILDKTNIHKEDKLLEIAPGTGQATIKFAEKGYSIHAVELGDNLARLLEENCKDFNVTVDVAPFEEWNSPNDEKYNMIFCATAFHWLDPDIKYKKTYEFLKEDGYLVLMWNNAIGTTNPIINEAYQQLFACYSDKPFSTKPIDLKELEQQDLKGIKDIEDSGYYKVQDFLSYTWSLKQNKDKTIKGFYTQSAYLSLEENIKKELTSSLEELFEDLENTVSSEFRTVVYICRKVEENFNE